MKTIRFLSILAMVITGSALAATQTSPAQKLQVSVTEKGFEPSHMQADAGRDVLLTITRKTDATCAKSVVVPKLKLKESLPLNKPVTLKLSKLEKGELTFACGMKMMSAVIEIK